MDILFILKNFIRSENFQLFTSYNKISRKWAQVLGHAPPPPQREYFWIMHAGSNQASL